MANFWNVMSPISNSGFRKVASPVSNAGFRRIAFAPMGYALGGMSGGQEEDPSMMQQPGDVPMTSMAYAPPQQADLSGASQMQISSPTVQHEQFTVPERGPSTGESLIKGLADVGTAFFKKKGEDKKKAEEERLARQARAMQGQDLYPSKQILKEEYESDPYAQVWGMEG